MYVNPYRIQFRTGLLLSTECRPQTSDRLISSDLYDFYFNKLTCFQQDEVGLEGKPCWRNKRELRRIFSGCDYHTYQGP